MRIAECGMRSLQCEVIRNDTHLQNSALRIPHSAFRFSGYPTLNSSNPRS